MLCGLLRLMSRLIPLVLLLRVLLLILLVPLLILLLMRGLLLSLMPRLPLIRRVTFIVALAVSAAIVASTSPAPPAASGFEASGQGMAAVGPVRAPVESSSTRTRPPTSSVGLKSVFNAKFLFSGAYEGGGAFKTRRLISCSDTSIS